MSSEKSKHFLQVHRFWIGEEQVFWSCPRSSILGGARVSQRWSPATQKQNRWNLQHHQELHSPDHEKKKKKRFYLLEPSRTEEFSKLNMHPSMQSRYSAYQSRRMMGNVNIKARRICFLPEKSRSADETPTLGVSFRHFRLRSGITR